MEARHPAASGPPPPPGAAAASSSSAAAVDVGRGAWAASAARWSALVEGSARWADSVDDGMLPPLPWGRVASASFAGAAAWAEEMVEIVSWLAATAVLGSDLAVGVTNVVHGLSADEVAEGGRLLDGTGPYVLVLFAGRARVGDLPSALRAAGARVVVVDVLVGGRFHDLLDHSRDSMGQLVMRAAERGAFAAIHCAIPCETFSVARGPGDVLRQHDGGCIPGLPDGMAAACQLSDALNRWSLDCCRAVVRGGGDAAIENPADRDGVLPHVRWEAMAGSASLFRMPYTVAYAEETGSVESTFPLCAFGAPWQKYITVLATPRVARLMAPLHGWVCRCLAHAAHAYGPEGNAQRSGEYPPNFAEFQAAVLTGAPPRLPVVSPLVVPGSAAEVALGSRVVATTAPGYVPPADPGWWDPEEEDLSDAESDVAEAAVGGVAMAYKASVKGGKVKYTMEEGVPRRRAIPGSFDEAMCHEDAGLLWEAVLREYHSQLECETWEQRPAAECYDAGRQPIDCRWVFEIKVDMTSKSLLFWKARLVARGDQMVHLRDFFETYAGVVRHSTFRAFMALAALWGLVLTGADVSTAYLHAPLRGCTVWMRPPRGFEHILGRMPDGTPALLRLRMALYGLRQSAREWAITLREWLLAWRSVRFDGAFRRYETDSYVFEWRSASGVVLLLLYVDDIFLAHSSDAMRADFMEQFSARFRVKDLGLLRQGLGADIAQDLEAGTVSMSLARYLTDVSTRFDLHVDNAWADIPVPVALARECRAARPTPVEVAEHDAMCRVLTGVVVHAATFLRVDVQYAAQLLSSLPSCAAKQRLCRRVLGYLARTRDLRITYRRDAGGDVQAARAFWPEELAEEGGALHMPTDADHGDARSVTGWMVMLAGAALTWGSRAQPLPSLSSTEAELYGLSTAVCDLNTCINFLEEAGLSVSRVNVFCDSRGARLLASDCAAPARTRHVHRRWFFVRYYADTGRICIKEIKGGNNPSNFLTKAVGGSAFAQNRAYALGMR